MNLFEMINQFNKNNTSIYGELMENKFNPESNLSSTEKTWYNQIKGVDTNRFKTNENRNLIDNIKIQSHPIEVSGIGNVMQIC